MTTPELFDQLIATVDEDVRASLIKQAAEIAGSGANALDTADQQLAINPSVAISYAEIATEIGLEVNDFLLASSASRVKGQALRSIGLHHDAIQALNTASEYANRGGDDRLEANVQLGIIDSLGMIGEFDAAVELAIKLEAVSRELGDTATSVKALTNRGNIHFRRDEHQKALECYQIAKEDESSKSNLYAVALLEANTGNALASLNRSKEAIEAYQTARGYFQEVGMAKIAILMDLNEGKLRHEMGEHTTAVALHLKARTFLEAGGYEFEKAWCELDLAHIYRDLNLLPEALATYDGSIKQFIINKIPSEEAKGHIGKAQVLRSLKRYDEALTEVDQAHRLFSQLKNRAQVAYTYFVRAMILIDTDKSAEAKSFLKMSTRELIKVGLSNWATESQYLDIEIDTKAGINRIRSLNRIVQTAAKLGRFWLQCRTERLIGQSYQSRGKISFALKHYRNAVQLIERMRLHVTTEEFHTAFLKDKMGIYESLVAILIERGRRMDIHEALTVVELSKSRLLLDRIHSGLAQEQLPLSEDIRSRLEDLRARVTSAYHHESTFNDASQGQRTRQAATTELLNAENEYRTALHEIEIAAAKSRSIQMTQAVDITIGDLQKKIGSNKVLFEYYVSNNKVCAFIVSENTVHAECSLTDISVVNHLIRRLNFHLSRAELLRGFLNTSESDAEKGINSVLARLYDLLIRPFASRLNTDSLVIVPHSSLHGLPFHAFLDGETAMIDRYDIAYAPSSSIWYDGNQRSNLNNKTSSEEHSTLLMGVPTEDLPHIREEIDTLAQFMPEAQLYCGETASLSVFKEQASRCRYIHLATHAVFRSDNPMFSGLRFSDGWLFARDLYEMNLNCDLATLSACRTGAVKIDPGDEMFGLIRGFLIAGAGSLVLSLWPADDRTTSMLMQRFYHLIKLGKPRPQAISEAQRYVRHEFPNPYYWAPFVLYGH